MSRKLNHSLRALAVTLGVFAAVLSIGVTTNLPIPQEARTVFLQDRAAQEIVPAATQAAKDKPSPSKQRLRRREAREELAMPFFSFAHGLRRSNGS